MQRSGSVVVAPMGVSKTSKRAYKKRKVTLQKLARQVSSMKRDSELKWIDTSTTSYTSGLVSCINAVTLGDEAFSRDGRKITNKSILITGYGASADTKGAPRILVVYDKQTNGTQPLITDILTENNWAAPMNLNNRDRFKILYDNVAGLGKGTNPLQVVPANSGGIFYYHKYIKCDLPTVFGEAASGVAMIKTGGLFIVYVGTGLVSIVGEFRTRVRFTDS